MCFMLACFFAFLFNWVFLFPVSKFYHHGIEEKDTIDEKVNFYFYWVCSLFQLVKCSIQLFMMYVLIKLTDGRNLKKFERMVSSDNIRVTDIRISEEISDQQSASRGKSTNTRES